MRSEVVSKYVDAIYEAGVETDQLAVIDRDLRFIRDVCYDDDVSKVLDLFRSDSVVSKELLLCFCENIKSSLVINLLKILNINHMMNIICDVADEYIEMRNPCMEFKVTKTSDVSADVICSILKDHFGDVNVKIKNDDTLIAGFKIEYKERVYDNSLSYFLLSLKNYIISDV